MEVLSWYFIEAFFSQLHKLHILVYDDLYIYFLIS